MRRSILVAAAALAAAAGLLAGARAAPSGAEWPRWRGPGADGVWRDQGLIEKFAGPDIPIRWRAPISNGYTGPTVAAGRVYVMDRIVEPQERERVLCFDSETGRARWTHQYAVTYRGLGYPNGPRACVTIDKGLAFALGAMGQLSCLDASTGAVRWAKDLNTAYRIRMPDWGIAASPVIEGDLCIVQIAGEGSACVVAFDLRTGQERWKALPDRATYSTPVVITQADRRVLICWTAERVVGLDPATGRLYWEHPHPSAALPDAIISPVVSGEKLFVSSWYEGALMLRLVPDRLAVQKLWHRRGPGERNTDALHTLMAAPIITADTIYGLDTYGEFRALDAATGDRIWENRNVVPRGRNATVHMVRSGDRVWIFNESGELIIARLSRQGYQEISRARLLKPTRDQFPERRGGVCWSHPAYAYGHVFARSDVELVCADLRAKR